MNQTPSLHGLLRAEWERSAAWTLATAAVLTLFLGHRSLGASPFAAEEVAHLITGGIGALLLLVAAVGLLVSADLRDEADKLDRIDARLGKEAAAPRRRFPVVSTSVVALGLLLVTAGWARAAGTPDFDRSLSGLGLAVVGFMVVVAAVAARSLAARRAVRLRIAVLVAAGVRPTDEPAGAATAATDRREWTADGLSRLHRRSCPGLASAAGPARLVDSSAAGLEPCLICHRED